MPSGLAGDGLRDIVVAGLRVVAVVRARLPLPLPALVRVRQWSVRRFSNQRVSGLKLSSC